MSRLGDWAGGASVQDKWLCRRSGCKREVAVQEEQVCTVQEEWLCRSSGCAEGVAMQEERLCRMSNCVGGAAVQE